MNFSNKINFIEMDNDSLFKAMFLDKKCRPMVSAVLSRITKIKEEKILNAKFIGGIEYPKTHKLEKKKISDIVIEVDDNTVILVEANKFYYKSLFLKNESYAFSTFTRRTHIKDNVYPNVYLVNINSFSHLKQNDPVTHMLIQDKKDNVDTYNFHIYHYDIAKTALLSYNEDDEILIRFAKFMKSKTLEELKEHAKGDERFMFSFDMIDGYIGDDARVVTYDREALHAWEKEQIYNDGIEEGTRQGIAQGIAKGIEEGTRQGIAKGIEEGTRQGIAQGIEEETRQGISQGIDQRNKEIINSMLENKMSISEISKILKMPENKIKEIIKQ